MLKTMLIDAYPDAGSDARVDSDVDDTDTAVDANHLNLGGTQTQVTV